MAHATLSPSSAARWMSCPGSVLLSKDMPNESSVYAEEGTRAHAKAEEIIKSLIKGGEMPAVIEGFPELGVYIRYAKALMDDGWQVYPEVRVPLKDVTGESAYGTSDLVATKGGAIEIVDLKWGAGVPVSADHNMQLMIYAMGAADLFSFDGPFSEFKVTIVQPRVVSPTNGIDSFSFSAAELAEARAKVKAAAELAMAQLIGAEEPTFCPSKKACRWCRAAGVCSAFAKQVSDTVGIDFPIVEDERTLKNAQRAEIFKKIDDVRAWAEQFESALLADAMAGEKFPGLKLVLGRAGARKWRDEQVADDILNGLSVSQEDRYKRKLISPSDVEKLYKAGLISDDGWSELCKQTVRPEPKPVLVPDSDKREEYKPVDAGSQFSNLDS